MDAILGILDKLLAAFNTVTGWFKKTVTQKVDDDEAKIRQEMDDFKKNGRPD